MKVIILLIQKLTELPTVEMQDKLKSMLTQVQRGESAPRVTGQYTQGVKMPNQGHMGSRNQQRAANSMAPQ